MTHSATIENDLRYEHCPLCSSERVSRVGRIPYDSPTRFSTSEFEFASAPELWHCKGCGSSFVQNAVPEETAISLYTSGASGERWSSEEFQLLKPENQLSTLNGYLKAGASVLDIGCNTGELLDYARARGTKTTGVEYSGASRKVLERKGYDSFASLADVTGEFDVITAFDLVEHFYDVPGFFQRCKALLKKGGVLVILTGDIGSLTARVSKADWWYLRYPEHIVFPSREFFARHSGLRLEKWVRTYASKGYEGSWSQILRQLLGGLVRRRYSGLPSIGPDHVLVVLKNER
jgi:SAM-dependent methyltransferase